MGKEQRVKGTTFERDVAKQLRDLYPDAKRGLQFQGAIAPDVVNTPFWIECKKGKRTSPKAAISQAIEDSKKTNVIKGYENLIPLAVTRDDNKPILATMQFDDFLSLLTNGGLKCSKV